MPKQSKEDKYESTTTGPCDLACLRGLLIGFNFIFILGGICALAIGIWTVIMKMQYVAILSSIYYNMIVYLLIGAGVLVFVTGVLGCVGAIQKNNTMLTYYFVLLVIIFLCECIAGILAFVYHETIHDELSTNLKIDLNRNYNATGQKAFTEAVDLMQQNFKCCGVLSYEDWQQSTFIKSNTDGLKTPESCCKTVTKFCSRRDHPSNIYRVLGAKSMGCLLKLEHYIQEHLFILAITGVAVACLEILVMVFTCCLRSSIKKEEDMEAY